LAPEILIVGDRSQRGSLIPRVQDLGYTVTPVRERELSGRVAGSSAAMAVLICLGETDAATLVDAARRGRDDVPLILVGSLGGELRDLADVLELGADHFLGTPVSDEELSRVLTDLVGPGAPSQTEDDELPESVRPLTEREARDPMLGQLHRTLEILAARLKTHGSGEAEPDDLESLGLDALPDVDQGLGTPEVESLLANPEPSDPAASRRPELSDVVLRRPEATQRLSGAGSGGDDTQRLRWAGQDLGAVPGDRSDERASRGGIGDSPARVLAPRVEPGAEATAEGGRIERGAEARVEGGRVEATARLVAPARPVQRDGSDTTTRLVAPARPVQRDGSDTTARLAAPRADLGRAVDVTRAEPLAGIEVLRRLWQLHARGFDGRLIVGFAGGVVKQVWWRRGEPVYAASTAAADGLLQRLQARGLVGRGQQAAARVIDGELMASAQRLVKLGLLKPREQHEVVRDAVQRICESLCGDAAERWHIDHAPAPAELDLHTTVLALLAAGARVGLGSARMRAALPDSMALRLHVDDLEGLAAELGWPGAEDWLELFDGSRGVGQLAAEDGIDERDLWVVGCVLLAAGLAAMVEVDAEAAMVAIDRRRIDERLALARDSDYFSLLGVAREAGRAELLRAHADLRDTFAAERLEPRTREELADALAELHAALDEAREVLLDEVLRSAYLAQLSGGS